MGQLRGKGRNGVRAGARIYCLPPTFIPEEALQQTEGILKKRKKKDFVFNQLHGPKKKNRISLRDINSIALERDVWSLDYHFVLF